MEGNKTAAADASATTAVVSDSGHPTSTNACAHDTQHQVIGGGEQVPATVQLDNQANKPQHPVSTPTTAGKKRKIRDDCIATSFSEEQRRVLLNEKLNKKRVNWKELSKSALFQGFKKSRLKTAAESLFKLHQENLALDTERATAQTESVKKQLVAEIVFLRKQHEQLKARHEEEVESMRKVLDAAKAELASNRTEVARANEDVARLRADLTKIEEEKAATKASMQKLLLDTQRTREELEDAQISEAAVKMTRKQAEAAQAQVIKLKRRLECQTMEFEAATAQEKSQAQQIAALSASLKERTLQKQQYEGRVQELTIRKNDAESSHAFVKDQLVSVLETMRLCCEVDEAFKRAAYELSVRHNLAVQTIQRGGKFLWPWLLYSNSCACCRQNRAPDGCSLAARDCC